MLDRSGMECILGNIEYKDWTMAFVDQADIWLIWPVFNRVDAITGSYSAGINMRPWVIERWRSEAYVVQTAFAMIKMAEEHETREEFKYNGEAIYSPHKIESLLSD